MTCCHFILSSHPASGGTWVMTSCCGNVWDLLTSVNNPDHCIRMTYVDHPDVLCKPSGWYIYKCRLIFLKVVRKSVLYVLYKKIRMRVTRMTISAKCHRKMHATCHCKMRDTCSRIPTITIILAKGMYHPQLMGKVKKQGRCNLSLTRCFEEQQAAATGVCPNCKIGIFFILQPI